MAIGIPNINLDLSALANLTQGLNLPSGVPTTQGPVLGPDDFGSYTIPFSDPTYRSGFDYARSIAGGMPMSQVIAPGVSYSPEQPMGYTQEQLNTPVGTTPVEPPPPPPEKLPAPDEPGYGQGIGGVTIFDDVFDRKRMPPLRDIFGGFQKPDLRPDIQPITPPIQTPSAIDIDAIRQQIAESGIDFGNLLGIPKIEQPDLSQFVRREDIPSLIPEVPTGREFSIEDIRSGLDLPDFTKFARQEDIPSIPTFVQPDLTGFARLEDIPQIPTFDREALIEDIRSGIDIPQPPSIDREALIKDITGRIDLPKPPSIDRQALIEDIRSGIELPTYQAPDLSGFARLEDIPQIPTFDPRDYREDFLSIAREGIDIPQYEAPDLSGYARLEDIPTFDPTGLQEQITALQQRPGFDPTSIQQDISQLQTRPQFDPTGLQQQISGLQEQIGAIPQFDPTGLQQQIGSLEQQIGGIPQFDPSGLQEQISGLQQQIGGIPQFDPTALQEQIAANQAALAGIDIPTAPDVSQFVTQEDIQRAISGINIPTYQAPDLSGFARLEDIPTFDPSVLKQDILMSLPQTQVPDVSQFVTQEDIQKAIAGIDIPTFQAPDFSPYETRIAELEQQLAGLQTPTGGRFSVDQQLPRGLF